MKRTLLVAAIFSLTIFGVFAQRGQQKTMLNPEERAEKMTAKMTEQLELSEDQKKQIYQINLDNATKRQAEMEARKEEMRAKRAAMVEKNKSQQAQIEAILTPEQKTKWVELKDENRERRNTIRDGRQNPDREKFQQRRKRPSRDK
jgi:Spy/CpxP family protein refolding chaperone